MKYLDWIGKRPLADQLVQTAAFEGAPTVCPTKRVDLPVERVVLRLAPVHRKVGPAQLVQPKELPKPVQVSALRRRAGHGQGLVVEPLLVAPVDRRERKPVADRLAHPRAKRVAAKADHHAKSSIAASQFKQL